MDWLYYQKFWHCVLTVHNLTAHIQEEILDTLLGCEGEDLTPVNRVGEDKGDKLKQGTMDSQSLLLATELTVLMEISG